MLIADVRYWIVTRGPWWATSIVAHAVAMSFALLLLGTVAPRISLDSATSIESAAVDTEITPVTERLVTADLPPLTAIDLVPSSATADLTIDAPPSEFGDASGLGDVLGGDAGSTSATGEPHGGNPFDVGQSMDLRARSPLSVDGPLGRSGSKSASPGSAPFAGRGPGRVAGTGRTKAGDRAVARALEWIARHQNADGSWSLRDYTHQCQDATCTGAGNAEADSAATALGLLPFLAAGQTHLQKGPYAKNIYQALLWLAAHQKPDGDLSAGSSHRMYAHGLATIALAEAAGMTRDRQLRAAAQQAVKYIEAAQNKSTGGWRYQPGEAGDTSVLGWQVMALKSAQMAGLAVDPQVLSRASAWLETAAAAEAGRFAYQPDGPASPTNSAIGLLATQYLGAKRNDPRQQGGQRYLLANLPEPGTRNSYYWYYATQAMHNLQGAEWDLWNRKMRSVLIGSQATTGCAAGSWDPILPSKDTWSDPGGRLLVTSLNCLTLEVYYRYLPLYRSAGDER